MIYAQQSILYNKVMKRKNIQIMQLKNKSSNRKALKGKSNTKRDVRSKKYRESTRANNIVC